MSMSNPHEQAKGILASIIKGFLGLSGANAETVALILVKMREIEEEYLADPGNVGDLDAETLKLWGHIIDYAEANLAYELRKIEERVAEAARREGGVN